MKPVIVKYSNRKFYCRKRKKHLTLLDIYADFLDKESIEVVEHKTGRDITSRTILQSVVDFGSDLECNSIIGKGVT